MIRYKLKYGFLGTYRSTVFMRRVADYKFEMSPPVDYRATQPSLRECFMAFTAFAADDGAYNQAPDFNIRLVRATSSHELTMYCTNLPVRSSFLPLGCLASKTQRATRISEITEFHRMRRMPFQISVTER